MSAKSQISFLLALIVSLLGQSLHAVTKVAVGPSTCQPSLVHFSTIGAAVAAVPYGTTILVCPGTYPEQVVITQPLTIQGITDGVGNAAVITVPAAGLTANGSGSTWFYGGSFAAHILIQGAVGVTISDLIVDGTGDSCTTSGVFGDVGIDFINVGTSSDGTAAGKVQNVTVRNVKNGCGGGYGIMSDNSYITINGNEVHDTDEYGILTWSGTRNAVTNNSVQRPGYGGIGYISWGYPPAPVTGNSVSGASEAGIFAEEYVIASKNTITNSPVGLWVYFAFFSTITQNTVSNSTYGLEVNYSYYNTIQQNVITGSSQDGIRDEGSFGGNNITKNTVNEAAFGIYDDASASADTLVPNNMYNVVVTIDPGTLPGPGTPSQPIPPQQ